MPVEIGELKLTKVHQIKTLEEANFVYHRVPGMEGAAVQNLGRGTVRLQIDGIFYGPAAREGLEKLRAIYLKREPEDFIAEIVGQSYVGKVILDRFDVTQTSHEPEQFSYKLFVSEYVKPPKKTLDTDAVDKKIKMEAKAMLDMATLPDNLALGSIPEITNPFEPLKGALDPLKEAANGLYDSISGLKTLFGG